VVKIIASYPAGVIASTPDNLMATAEGKNLEWTHSTPALQIRLYKKALEIY
jgi:hypothetical protein